LPFIALVQLVGFQGVPENLYFCLFAPELEGLEIFNLINFGLLFFFDFLFSILFECLKAIS